MFDNPLWQSHETNIYVKKTNPSTNLLVRILLRVLVESKEYYYLAESVYTCILFVGHMISNGF